MLSDRTFKRKYRVSKRTFSEILEKIKPSIEGRPRDHRCFNGSAGKVDTDIKLACALRQLSGGSYQRKSANGVIGGCVGAIDGLLVKIYKPPLPVQNPARFMSRKHFFALNVQAICDSNTKFLCG